jgi:hypothetical protein
MMDYFIRLEFTTKMILHLQSVFKSSLVFSMKIFISSTNCARSIPSLSVSKSSLYNRPIPALVMNITHSSGNRHCLTITAFHTNIITQEMFQ